MHEAFNSICLVRGPAKLEKLAYVCCPRPFPEEGGQGDGQGPATKKESRLCKDFFGNYVYTVSFRETPMFVRSAFVNIYFCLGRFENTAYFERLLSPNLHLQTVLASQVLPGEFN